MNINGNMLNLEKEVRYIFRNDEHVKNDCKWTLHHSEKKPEWYEEMDFGIGEINWDNPDVTWRIYADALREFGVVWFVQDLTTGVMYTDKTRKTVKTLISQYGLRNVTNEFAKQLALKYNISEPEGKQNSVERNINRWKIINPIKKREY